MKAYLNHIIETIDAHRADFEKAGLTPPVTIDVYLGQVNRPEEFEFKLPAIFIDYTADYDSETFDLILHIVQDFGENTENFAQQRSKGLQMVDFITVLKRCLHELKMRPVFGPLRLYTETPVESDLYYHHQLVMRCSFDTTAYNAEEKYDDVQVTRTIIEGGLINEQRVPMGEGINYAIVQIDNFVE